MKTLLLTSILFWANQGWSQLKELKGEAFLLNLKYATTDNFLKTDLYRKYGLTRCFVRPELEEKLRKIARRLLENKLKLILWDCYRPLEVQKAMWKQVPDPRYVADPQLGSNHNRGAAIDLALADETGSILKFPSSFDDFSKKAHHDYVCSESETILCENRERLKKWMLEAGLRVFPTEWWHYELPNAEKYPVIIQKD